MISWEKHQKILHVFHGDLFTTRYFNDATPIHPKGAMILARHRAQKIWGKAKTKENAIRSKWRKRNTLDPNIHQGIFHFLRAQSLIEKDCYMESVVAFDCVFAAIKALLIKGKIATSATTRVEICQILKLPRKEQQLCEFLNFLRNNFGAHAGGWGWWDQYELFEGNEINDFSALTLRALQKAADLEPTIRTVEPAPIKWDDWFIKNFDMLWDTLSWGARFHKGK